MKKLLCIILAGVLSASLLPACGSAEPEKEEAVVTEQPTPTATATPTPAPTPKPTATPTPTPTPTAAPTSEPIGNVNPFTGEATDTDISNKRPFAFMINNISSAMPLVGVSQSALMLELMDEGGITRMMGIYQDPSSVEVIGSIRSARAYNVETAYGYDAILTHCGNSDEASWWIHKIFMMEDLDQIDGTYGEDVFYRDPDRSATLGSVHSLMARGPGVVAAAQARGYRMEHEAGYDLTQGFKFLDNAESQCTEDATHINVIYAGGKTSTFEYDAANKQYFMYQYGQELLDNGVERVPFSNVVMIYANTFLQEDGQHLTIELCDGDGYFFTGGKAVPITWYRSDPSDSFHFYLPDGSPVLYNRGRTFIAVNQCGEQQGSCEYSA